MYGVGRDQPLVSQIADGLGCRMGSLPIKYLGLPLGRRVVCCAEWNPVVDAFRARLSTWKAKHLSMGGHLTLVKSVLCSIPIYPLSVRLLPVRVRNNLQSIMSRFL